MKAWQKIHPEFQLNGKKYDVRTLIEFSSSKWHSSVEEERLLASFIKEWLSETDFVEMNTSGSTGTPKSIPLQKRNMIASAKATGLFFGLHTKTKALHCLPMAFVAGKMMLVRAMVLGWHLETVVSSSQPLLNTENNFDFAAMVPLQVQNSLEALSRIKKVIIGGAEVSKTLQNQLQTIETEAFATYGMTETITHIAVKKLNNFPESSPENEYKALPNVFFKTDSRNCLIISAPSIFEGKIITNDVVKLISLTSFEWLGRFDNVINTGAIKVYPEKIEHKLSLLLDKIFFIAGVPDEVFGEKVVLVVEGESNDLPENLFSGLEKYEIPKHIYFIPKFVYTENKKLQRIKTLNILRLNQ